MGAAKKAVGRSWFCFPFYRTNAKISFENYLFPEKAMMALWLLNNNLYNIHITLFVPRH